MTVLMFRAQMIGDAQGCKEVVAMELEDILRKIGWVEVRCVSAVEVPEGETQKLEGWR